MKYPLNRWHSAGRETMCFFFGHKWKGSNSVHTQWYDMDDNDVPYGIRRSSGNHWWENVAWWNHKCVRCRRKEHQNCNYSGHQPWYKEQYWAIKDGFRHAWFMFSFTVWPEKEEYFPEKKQPLWKRICAGIVLWFVGGFAQYWIHFDEIPSFPADVAFDIEYKIMEWTEEIQKK